MSSVPPATGAAAAPEVVVAWVSAEQPDDQDRSGFVSPFYAGEALYFGDPIPAQVITTLEAMVKR